jgi:hypothetical protein
MGVHVHCFHTTAGNRDLAPLPGLRAYLRRADTEQAISGHEQPGRRSGRISDEVSAIWHVFSSARSESNS